MTKWLALDKISLARIKDPDKQTDLVMRGETFERTEEQVAALLRPKQGPPRIIKAIDQSAAPTYRPRDLSGPLRGPMVGARPDPAGSSAIQVLGEIPGRREAIQGRQNDSG